MSLHKVSREGYEGKDSCRLCCAIMFIMPALSHSTRHRPQSATYHTQLSVSLRVLVHNMNSAVWHSTAVTSLYTLLITPIPRPLQHMLRQRPLSTASRSLAAVSQLGLLLHVAHPPATQQQQQGNQQGQR